MDTGLVPMRQVVLVEGRSDQAAVQALAVRTGLDLPGRGIVVEAMGGATNIGRYLGEFGPAGRDLGVCGLCDRAEAPIFRRALERAGLGPVGDDADLTARGFFVCDADLEEELIRALGEDRFEQVVRAQDDLRPLRSLQQQPAQRDRPVAAQLRRWLGSGGSRKIRYAPLLVQALPLPEVPRPLRDLMAWLEQPG